jgi:hypothetical protein
MMSRTGLKSASRKRIVSKGRLSSHLREACFWTAAFAQMTSAVTAFGFDSLQQLKLPLKPCLRARLERT